MSGRVLVCATERCQGRAGRRPDTFASPVERSKRKGQESGGYEAGSDKAHYVNYQ